VAIRRFPVILIAACALAAGGPAAADDRPKTRIVIKKLKHSGASGKLSAGNSGCLGGRKVSLFRLEGFVSRKIAITHSNSHGRWRVRKDLPDGRYFAKVDRGNGCRYDNSKTETLR
jgi:hypothetical protein